MKTKRIKKTKNQVIVVPTTQKTKKTKLAKTLSKSRSVRSKENKVHKNLVSAKQNTLNYFECLQNQIAGSEGIKITKLCSWCRVNKGKVATAKQMDKRELVKKVAQSYLEFGKGLGHLLHANIVSCSCK